MEENSSNFSQIDSTPQSVEKQRSKSSNPFKIATIVLVVLALGGLGFGIYELSQVKSARQQISDLRIEVKSADGPTTTIETDKIEVKDDAKTIVITDVKKNDAEDIKKLIGEMRSAAAKHFGVGETYFFQTFDYGSTIIIPGTSIKTSTNESYSFAVPNSLDELGERVLREVPDVAKEVLSNNGFTSSQRLDRPLNWISLYYNPEKDIYCLVPESSSSYSVDCTKTSWLTDEKKELVLALAKAAGDYARNWVDAEPDDIVDSPISPYQRITATTNGAFLLFYRNSPTAEWNYLGITQMDWISCEEYNEDAKKAFSGTKCWDKATETEVEL